MEIIITILIVPGMVLLIIMAVAGILMGAPPEMEEIQKEESLVGFLSHFGVPCWRLLKDEMIMKSA
jgi:hypothetical protein